MKNLEINPLDISQLLEVIQLLLLSTCYLTEIEESEIIKTVKYKENLFRTKLTNPKIKNIQGVGLMLALILNESIQIIWYTGA